LLGQPKILPYELIAREGTNVSYTFFTESGIQYVIRFIKSTDYFFDDSIDIGDTEIFEFQFLPVDKNLPKVKDPRVVATLVASIKFILEKEKNAILYICDRSDGKAEARSKLFHQWFKHYSWDSVSKYDGRLLNPNSSESEYVSLIINNQNPFAKTVVEAFSYSIESQK
jgi:hypothetical protein